MSNDSTYAPEQLDARVSQAPMAMPQLDRLDLFRKTAQAPGLHLQEQHERSIVADDGFGINMEVAAVGMADKTESHKLKDGGTQTNYTLDGNVVFSDVRRGDGVRVRSTYDMGGGCTGKRIDFKDGSHSSKFGDGFDDYMVMQDKNGTQVLKRNEDGKYQPVVDRAERQDILDKEREQFQAPRVMHRAS